MSKVVYEGWMVRYGRRKIGRSFIHMRYFVLETRVLAYYKRKPQDNMVPIKTLLVDGNCRVEDRGLKMHHGHTVYVLCVYNKKEKYHRITMAAFNIQEALIWKEKIEQVIDQQQDLMMANGNKVYASFQYKPGMDNGRNASSSDHESQCSPEEEEENHHTLLRRTTIGNGPPESVLDWTQEVNSGLSNQNNSDQVFSRKHWRLVRCQNGLRIFEELLEVDYLPRSCSRAMQAVGVVEATCESIFELIMSMDGTRFEWDCSFQYGSLVQEVDGHTAILYHRLQLDWFPMFVWPRDLCYVRYWRRNDDGSYVVLFRSREHPNCGPQPGFVRAHIESGGFNISPLKPRNGRPRTQVQHLMQIDLKGWGVGYFPSFQQHCLLQMLNSVAGLREWFCQTDESHMVPRMPMMVNMTLDSVSSKKKQKIQENSVQPSPLVDQMHSASRHSVMLDEDSDEDEDYQIPELEQEAYSVKLENGIKQADEEPSDQIDLSGFSGSLRRDDRDKSRDCWRISDGSNFRVRSKHFIYDKTKIPAGKHLMELVAVDWYKDVKRMDHVARRKGCAVQVASEKGLFSLAINLEHVVFGKVVKGMGVVRAIEHTPVGEGDYPNVDVIIVGCGELSEGADDGVSNFFKDGDMYPEWPNDLDEKPSDVSWWMNAVDSAKAFGNDNFKKQDFKMALRKYRKALRYLDVCWEKEEIDEEKSSLLRKTKSIILTNSSACKLKLGDSRGALLDADFALREREGNAKAYYRQGQAHMSLGDVDAAAESFKKALELEPNDGGIKKELAAAKKKIADRRDQERKAYSRMFRVPVRSDANNEEKHC